MSIRDIIEAAKSDWVLDGMSPKGGMFLDHEDDQRFIATFDPEHVSLMEAVCEAENDGTDEELTEAGATLQAYRKKRGL